MEKKLVLLALVILILPFVTSIPQFLIFQGDVKIDGRIATSGTLINFSINGIQMASSSVNASGQYWPVVIQGFSQYYGNRINITINGYTSQQIVYYIYPQDINLDLSTLTEKALKITDFFPMNNNVEYKTGNYTFNVSTQTGYSDSVSHAWFLDGNKVLEDTDTDFSSYVYERLTNDASQHKISVIASDGYLSVSQEWTLLAEKIVLLKKLAFGHRQIGEFCEPNWKCSVWSQCNEGIITRRCMDTNNCVFSYNKPAETTGCEQEILVSKNQGNNYLPVSLGITGFLIVVLIILLLVK